MNAKEQAAKKLVGYYIRNGCLRQPDDTRFREGQLYKKGWEIRFSAKDEAELELMKKLLATLGFSHGQPYQKRKTFMLTVYGSEQFSNFLALLEKHGANAGK